MDLSIRSTYDYDMILTECFVSDKRLLDHYHIKAGEGLVNCVVDTADTLRKNNVEMIAVYLNKELIGYFGKEPVKDQMFLTGFFVKPQYRTSQIMKAFWSLVIDELGESFFCGLYSHNTPAINFIKKQGAICVATYKDNGLVFKVGTVCQ